MQARLTGLAAPLPTVNGYLWIAGRLAFSCAGSHNRDVVSCSPAGVVIPNLTALIGREFTVQGGCGGRLSNALTQTIGG
jgi:hypothetical protein